MSQCSDIVLPSSPLLAVCLPWNWAEQTLGTELLDGCFSSGSECPLLAQSVPNPLKLVRATPWRRTKTTPAKWVSARRRELFVQLHNIRDRVPERCQIAGVSSFESLGICLAAVKAAHVGATEDVQALLQQESAGDPTVPVAKRVNQQELMMEGGHRDKLFRIGRRLADIAAYDPRNFLPQEIEAFRNRYEQAFGERLSQDAEDLMDRLEELYRVILKRLPEPPSGSLPSNHPS